MFQFSFLRMLEAQRLTRPLREYPKTIPATKQIAQSFEHVQYDTAFLQQTKHIIIVSI